MESYHDVLVVGGGITGLTATYHLQQAFKRRNLPYSVRLLEASGRIGGKIHTVREDGFIIERGADSFLGRKQPALDLVEELGLTDELVRNEVGRSYILLEDKLHSIPEGSFMGIPTKRSPIEDTELLSEEGKTRVWEELTIPKQKVEGDQSLGAFLRRRLGDEAVDHLIEPLLAGVYSSDVDRMSLLATFPNFYQLEQKEGSLIEGLRKTMSQRQRSTGTRKGQFFTFKDGLSRLPEALYDQLEEGSVNLHTKVEKIELTDKGYRLHTSQGVMEAKACLLAIPHKEILPLFADESFSVLEEISVSSVANVVFVFNKEAIPLEKEATGFVVSRKGDYEITACTWTTKKWPHTTPEDYMVLRAYVGKPTAQEIVFQSDDAIIEKVMQDLKRVLPIQEAPLTHYITRYPRVMPQYTVGHLERLTRLEEKLAKDFPGLYLSGSSYRGVGIPDCIAEARKTADEILTYIG